MGLGFKKTDPKGCARLYWVILRDLVRFGNTWQGNAADSLLRFAIPEEN